MNARAWAMLGLFAAGCRSTSKASPVSSPSSAAAASPTDSTMTTATAAAAGASAAAELLQSPPKPYDGPTGALTGMVRLKGDAPPDTPHRYPKSCGGEAAATYGKLFRVGQDHALADAIVAVTRYQGFVPPKDEVIPITVRRCAFSTRSVAMTDGQHLEVRNIDDDTTTYIPWLDGSRAPAALMATPHGDPVKLYSRGYGRYWLRDQMGRGFMVAHVFHLHYATTSVTGLDGKYRIEGIPAGKIEVAAMLPQAVQDVQKPEPIPLSVSQSFEIKAGDNTLDIEVAFDAKKNTPAIPEERLKDEKPK